VDGCDACPRPPLTIEVRSHRCRLLNAPPQAILKTCLRNSPPPVLGFPSAHKNKYNTQAQYPEAAPPAQGHDSCWRQIAVASLAGQFAVLSPGSLCAREVAR